MYYEIELLYLKPVIFKFGVDQVSLGFWKSYLLLALAHSGLKLLKQLQAAYTLIKLIEIFDLCSTTYEQHRPNDVIPPNVQQSGFVHKYSEMN